MPKKPVFLLLQVAISCVVASATAGAQPAVVTTSGTWSHKSTVTITGSGFGAKTTAAPIVWDDASSGDVSDRWDAAWPNCAGNSDYNLAYRTPSQAGRSMPLPHAYVSRYIAGAHYGPVPAPDCSYSVILWKVRTMTSFPAYSYASWYQRVDDNWHFNPAEDDNFKTFAYSEGEGPYNFPNNWYLEYNPRPTSRVGGATWHLNDDAIGTPTQSLQNPDRNGNSHFWGDAVNPMAGAWSKVEMEIKYTSLDEGYVKLWENGVLAVDYHGSTDRLPGNVRTEGIGGYARNYPDTSNWRFFADVYLDYSRARVILGNAPTLNASTIREVQIPTSWSSSSISVSVNLGAFAAGQVAYLFVVDENGTANGAGVPVTVAPGPVADTIDPTVSLTRPAAGSPASGLVTVEVAASDNVGVAGVTLRVDGVSVGPEDTTSPYLIPWNSATATNGPHILTALARDAAGNQRISAPITVTSSNPSAPTTTGLVASYSFDDGAGTILSDDSGHDHPGTISGGALWDAAGHHGAAIRFDGVDDLVTIPNAPAFDLGTGMTIEAWVNPATLSGWRTAVIKTRPAGAGETEAGLSYALYANNGTPNPAGTVNTGGLHLEAVGPSQIPVNAWTHLAATYDGVTLRLFVDGAEAASRSISGALVRSDRPLFIAGNDVWGEFFEGLIDDVRVYNRALSVAEIQVDMATPVIPPAIPDTGTGTTIFGPRTYTSNGRPVVEQKTFHLTDTTGEFVLRVDNSGVFGAVIEVNGRVVFRPPNARIETIDIPVTVRAGANQILVAFLGRRGASLTIEIVRRASAAPACVVTSPPNGSTLFQGESIHLTATATDNVRVTRMQFRSSDGSLDVDDGSAPWSAPFAVPLASGPLTFTVTAYDHVRNIGVCSSTVDVIQGPPPAVTLTSLTPGTVLTEGATMPMTAAVAAGRVPVSRVDFAVNGVTFASDATAPFSFLFTVPAGVDWLSVRASAVDSAGSTGTSGDVIVPVAPDPLTTLRGRVEDASRRSVAGADVELTLDRGLVAEVFDFHTTLSALPGLTGKTPSRTKVVSAANLRNPNYLFGINPFGLGAGSHAVRLTGEIRIAAAGIYTFTLGVNEGGRLIIGGLTLVNIPSATGTFQQASARVWAPPGSYPIELRTFDNGNTEIQLSYVPPGGTPQVVSPAVLAPGRALYQTRSGANGAFSLPGVATVLGGIAGSVTFTPARGRMTIGEFGPVAPVAGHITDVGLIRLR